MPMAGKLDEISSAIGEQRAGIAALKETFTQHCSDDDRRHSENIQAMQAINTNIRELTDALKPLATSVAFMRPIVDAYQESKWKTAGAVSLATTIVVAFGWLITSIVGELVKWIAAHVK